MRMIFPTLKEIFLKTLHSEIPYNACQNFGPISGLEIFCLQSKIYAVRRSLPADCIAADNLLVFFAILLISGYNKVPYR